jgi:hypothetical protein
MSFKTMAISMTQDLRAVDSIAIHFILVIESMAIEMSDDVASIIV